MRKPIILLLLICALSGAYSTCAQQANSSSTPAWPNTQASRGGFSFRTPVPSIGYDTLGLLSYFAAPDSALAFQVSFLDTVSVSGNQELFAYLNQINLGPGSDTVSLVLDAYAYAIADISGAELTNLASINYSTGIRGVEVRLRMPDGNGSYQHLLSRVYYWQRKFLGLTVSCTENRLTQAINEANIFFSSVVISP